MKKASIHSTEDASGKWFTFARKYGYTFGVNPIGEIYRNGEYLPCSSVNVADLERRLGRPATDKDFRQEFRRLERLVLTPDELAVTAKICRFQNLCDADFRVYGGILDDRTIIQLCIEFCLFDTDREGWRLVRGWITEQGGDERLLDHRRHCDKWGRENPKTGKIKWSTGKNHNCMETQIEVFWDLTHRTIKEAKELIHRLRKSFESVWANYGVAVF